MIFQCVTDHIRHIMQQLESFVKQCLMIIDYMHVQSLVQTVGFLLQELGVLKSLSSNE